MTAKVDAIIAHLMSLSDEEIREHRHNAGVGYFMHRLYRLRPGQELTVEGIEMHAQVCRQWPASTRVLRSAGRDQPTTVPALSGLVMRTCLCNGQATVSPMSPTIGSDFV